MLPHREQGQVGN